MEIQFDEYISKVADGASKALLVKLQEVAGIAANEGCAYVTKQCGLIKKYLDQKKNGEINEEEFKSLLTDLGDMVKLESLKANLATRQLVADLANICIDIAKSSLAVLIAF